MSIEFSCPHCKHPLKAEDEHAEKNGKCPKCGKELTVPAKSG
jgi:transcription initiation factor IIE alpha subunit